ncbi:MAG: SAM-dependent methyltransferase [Burkholderiaceae bacterium]|nr:SAM-dependent methyltransferase [Burkholderiaceae bacterium]
MCATAEHHSVSSRLRSAIVQAIESNGGWLPFDRYMSLALYAPGLGYYMHDDRQIGRWPGGSDFITAPELTPLFAQALAPSLRQALQASETHTLIEFGAGSGALAEGLLEALGNEVGRYCIVELSGALRARQQQRLARHGGRVQWIERWSVPAAPATDAVVLGNEVLDAMPVQLLHFDGALWHERGVALDADGAFAWRDRPTALRPPHDGPWTPGTVTEIHVQAEAFISGLAQTLRRGVALFVDYGFPADEYYHPQRTAGTLMCHRAHRADSDPLIDVGEKDITAHVNFSGIALAGQAAGFDVLGYTSQARFLLNNGIADSMARADARERAAAQKLVAEHEMGELFKVIGFAKGCVFDPIGFAAGDRSHRL